jgi:mannosyl-3-phosphoglycerate phosphatase
VLPSNQIIFTAAEGLLDQRGAAAAEQRSEALDLLSRQRVAWVIWSHKTRAQLESMRRNLEHVHPFITEGGGGLFIPDGYFNFHLDGATRVARYFCVPFAKSSGDAAAALNEIAAEAGAEVVSLSEMSIRDIARNMGVLQDEAEGYKHREFSELFFFAGETEKATQKFSEVAAERGWKLQPGEPFWEIRAPLRPGSQSAVQYLMNIYRKGSHGRLRSAGIGSGSNDLNLLCATDVAALVPQHRGEPDAAVSARFPRALVAERSGPGGWAEAVTTLLRRP